MISVKFSRIDKNIDDFISWVNLPENEKELILCDLTGVVFIKI